MSKRKIRLALTPEDLQDNPELLEIVHKMLGLRGQDTSVELDILNELTRDHEASREVEDAVEDELRHGDHSEPPAAPTGPDRREPQAPLPQNELLLKWRELRGWLDKKKWDLAGWVSSFFLTD